MHSTNSSNNWAKQWLIAVRKVKQAIDCGYSLPIEDALLLELEVYNQVVGTDDRREGINAFNEKRIVEFRNS